MLIQYIAKYLRRGIVANVLFCLLLALSGALLCLSAGLWYSADKAIRDIDKTITTIAVPNSFSVSRYMKDDSGEITEAEALARVREEVYASGLFEMDQRRLFGGYVEGVSPVAFRAGGIGLESAVYETSPQSYAAFVATCIRVEDMYRFDWEEYDPDSGEIPPITNSVTARFVVDEIIRLNEGVTEPLYVDVDFSYLNADDTNTASEGEQYLLVGNYARSSMTLSFEGNISEALAEPVVYSTELDNQFLDYLAFFCGGHSAWSGPVSERVWTVSLDNGEMIQAEEIFPLEASKWVMEEESGTGYSLYDIDEVDFDQVLDISDIATETLQVLTTNNPNSLLRLNQRRDFLTEGRSFTDLEATNGDLVCLISAQLAEENGLEIGDVLPLSKFALVMGHVTLRVQMAEGLFRDRSFWVPSHYHTDLPLTEPQDYTIIGFYEILKAEAGDYAISPNTIIIPDRSFDDVAGEPVSRYEIPDYPMPLIADALIVPNGKNSEIKELLNTVVPGYGGLFQFYDQGYKLLMDTVNNMRFGMSWILALAFAGWVAVTVMFSLFYILRKRKEAKLLYAIGLSGRNRFGWIFGQCVVIIVMAQVLVLLVTVPLYDTILDTATRTAMSFTYSFRDMILSDAVEIGIRRELPLSKSPAALISTVAISTGLLLFISGFVSARTALFRSGRKNEES